MAVEKFSISLPEEVVAGIDQLADADGVTRSALIREATAEYIARRASAEYAEKRAQRLDAVIDGFEAIAADWGPDERTAADLVREIREESLGDA